MPIKPNKIIFRCIEMPDDVKLTFSNWTALKFRYNNATLMSDPECDVFELKCTVKNELTYKYIYSQIHEK
jgi:hypothetical protein